jgi:hypothetical protein
MKTFITAVNLTEKQAKQLIVTVYSAHYKYNGGPGTLSPDRLKKLSDDLFLLLTLPTGSEVVVSEHSRTKPGMAGYTTFHFKHEYRVIQLSVYGDETRMPKYIAETFLQSKSFGHFKHLAWDNWNYSIGKPMEEEREAQEALNEYYEKLYIQDAC